VGLDPVGPRLILCDLDRALTDHWSQRFAGYPQVEVRRGDFLAVEADAYVSPANSYGQMDGGLDWLLRERFGMQIERDVQAAIQARGGKLPVGEALVVETGDPDVPYLISAPTMETPAIVLHTQNAYYSMRAVLGAWKEFEAASPGCMRSIGVPGMCTGVGRMRPESAAAQMHRAYVEFLAELGEQGRNDGAD
jgi:O-acetyl-ADP-ribose deacetylase (regulator of RNase III)